MRNFHKERKTVKGVREWDAPNGRTYTTCGPIHPYNELLAALGEVAKDLQHSDREALRKIAWRLGMAGETHACEVIMEHAGEPKERTYLYGMVYPHGF